MLVKPTTRVWVAWVENCNVSLEQTHIVKEINRMGNLERRS